ncbi:MAG: PepSY domain-containing protein [Acidobacteriia bacterium]|nr:PepSY domain-containing protein [Terriglobia bacterium]
MPPRQALFRIHSWLGIGAGLYVAFMSLTGSILVFYPELYRALKPHPRIEAGARPLTRAELKNAALTANPGYALTWIWERKGLPAEIWMSGPRGETVHLFDPFTGRDLGRATPFSIQLLNTVKDLHTNLLSGVTGQRINGAGAILLALLALTGISIWWPGISRWRRHLRIRRHTHLKRLNWEFHSAAGFWAAPIVFTSAITAVVLVLESSLTLPVPPRVSEVSYNLHTVRASSIAIRISWDCATLPISLLAASGFFMWWNRRKKLPSGRANREFIISPDRRPREGRQPPYPSHWP